jgi:hypothetical protein
MRRVLEPPVRSQRRDQEMRVDVSGQLSGSERAHGCQDRTKWWARAVGGLLLAGSAVRIARVRLVARIRLASRRQLLQIVYRARLTINARTEHLAPESAAGRFEATIGLLTLVRRTKRSGIACAIGFSVALMLFGWASWTWSLPVIGLLAHFWNLEGLVSDRREPTSDGAHVQRRNP